MIVMILTELDWKGQSTSGYGRVHIGDNMVMLISCS